MRIQNPVAVTLLLSIAALLVAAPHRLLAQEIVTDRPDQTESAETVERGQVQLEAGWGASRSADGVETHALPQTLVRIGLAPRWELRLGWNGWVEERGVDGLEGVGDGELGAKLRLRSGDAGGPAVALLCGVSLPVGDDEVTSDEVDPSCRVSLAHELPAGWSLGYNLGAEWETVAVGRGRDSTRSRLLYTVAAGRGITERLGFFVELFGDVSGSDHGPARHHLDGGLTYLLRDNLQLDAFAGTGLSSAADDWLVGAGFSVRWPR